MVAATPTNPVINRQTGQRLSGSDQQSSVAQDAFELLAMNSLTAGEASAWPVSLTCGFGANGDKDLGGP